MVDCNDSELLKAALFLRDYSWIYNFNVTKLLSDSIIDRIPKQWVTFLTSIQVNNFNEVFLNSEKIFDDLPEAISKFIVRLRSINLHIDPRHYCCDGKINNISNDDKRGVSIKKIHEISRFAEFIEDKVSKSLTICDIGSGLGYLGEELTRRGFRVVGVETSEAHIARADTRGRSNRAHTFPTLNLTISPGAESAESLASQLGHSEDGVCLVGLHCCGDLTPSVLKLFSHCDHFQR